MNQFYKKYSLKNDEPFGEGCFGQMYSCRMIDDVNNDIVCCVKIIPINIGQNLHEEVHGMIRRLLSQQNSSINLVKIFDIFFDCLNLLIVMEKCHLDLSIEFDQLIEQNIWYSEEETFYIIQQIISGFQQLEQLKINHLNVNPENILISYVNRGCINERKIYKISDFGIRGIVEKLSSKNDFIWTGAPNYSAPQVLENGKYSSKSDIFSLGILFNQIIFKSKLPYDCSSLKKRYQSQQNLKINPYQAPQLNNNPNGDILKNLLEKMIVYNENERMSFQILFSHSIVKAKCQEDTFINNERSSFFNSSRILDFSINFEKKKKDSILIKLEQIERLLELFEIRFKICIYFINLINNDDSLIFLKMNIYLIAQYQILYALALIHIRPQEIHPLFLEDNDQLQLIDILHEVQNGIKNGNKEYFDVKIKQDQLQKEYHQCQRNYVNFQMQILLKHNLSYEQDQFFQLSRYTKINIPILLKQITKLQTTQSVNLSCELQNLLDQIIKFETLLPVSLYKNNQDLYSLLPNQIKEKIIFL